MKKQELGERVRAESTPSVQRQRRIDSALERKALSDARSPQQQLARLDRAFGQGQGAKKERAKLLKRIEAQNPPKEEKGD